MFYQNIGSISNTNQARVLEILKLYGTPCRVKHSFNSLYKSYFQKENLNVNHGRTPKYFFQLYAPTFPYLISLNHLA